MSSLPTGSHGHSQLPQFQSPRSSTGFPRSPLASVVADGGVFTTPSPQPALRHSLSNLSAKPLLVTRNVSGINHTPRSVTSVAHSLPTSRTCSPIILANVTAAATGHATDLSPAFTSPHRPIFLSSSPPPTTFEQLRQSQRNSSPARLPKQLTVNVSVHASPVSSAESAPGSPFHVPALPPSVALSAISAPDVPSSKEELRLIWKLAYPVALAIFFRIAMAVTDVAMLGHKDTDFLAAAAAAQVWMNITSAFLYRAFGSSLNTLCSQAFGAGNFKLVGIWLQQGLIFASLASLVVGVSWWFTRDVLILFQIDEHIADLGGTFARWSLIWLMPQIWMECLQRYFQAQLIIFPALVLNAIFVVVNALLNLLLIFGLPAGWWPSALGHDLNANGWSGFGFIGSPIATSISRWLMFILYYLYNCVYRRYHAKTFTGWTLTRSETFHPLRLKQYLLHQCLPNAIGVCLEEWQLEIVAVFATHLGSTAIATHNATLEIFFFLTSFMFGLVTAVTVRIGTYLGGGNALAARQVAIIGLKVSMAIGCLIGVCFVTLRSYIGRIYSSDPAIWSLAQHISVLVGASYALLSFFYTSMAILNGQGRPFIVAVSFLIGCWFVCLPMSYVFAFTLSQGLLGLWYALCLGYAIVTVIVAWSASRSDWDACVVLARERAEMKKKKEQAEEFLSTSEKRKRKRDKRRKKKFKQQQSTTTMPSSTLLGVDSAAERSATLQSSLMADDLSEGEIGMDDSSSYSSCSSSSLSSDGEDVWNAEEVRYRDEQLKQERAAAVFDQQHQPMVRPMRSLSSPAPNTVLAQMATSLPEFGASKVPAPSQQPAPSHHEVHHVHHVHHGHHVHHAHASAGPVDAASEGEQHAKLMTQDFPNVHEEEALLGVAQPIATLLEDNMNG